MLRDETILEDSNPLRAMIVYNGVKYFRYPEYKNRTQRVYYRSNGTGASGKVYLHRKIWVDNNGEVPAGYVVHHINGNPLDNRLENLDCIPETEHMKHHWTEFRDNPELMAKMRAGFEKGRPGAAAWHKTKKARLIMSKAMTKVWESKKDITHKYMCQCCGKGFQSKRISKIIKYCSPNCLSEARRLSGVDDETRNCAICGKEFKCNKYARKQTCNRSCGSKLTVKRKQAKC